MCLRHRHPGRLGSRNPFTPLTIKREVRWRDQEQPEPAPRRPEPAGKQASHRGLAPTAQNLTIHLLRRPMYRKSRQVKPSTGASA